MYSLLKALTEDTRTLQKIHLAKTGKIANMEALALFASLLICTTTSSVHALNGYPECLLSQVDGVKDFNIQKVRTEEAF